MTTAIAIKDVRREAKTKYVILESKEEGKLHEEFYSVYFYDPNLRFVESPALAPPQVQRNMAA
ncbi:hypothetical protein M8C21_018956 [Ambrosia artemisiifolia]|uniref:Uncharacterized protein n=1 Tax=Ambrosia artemisiifolia TaxID=4212 RepID=A0AAD5C876_AMBAR|nr:hypothetical protein M8C21_018956 [Ambrosia artemisiifolia]